MKPIDVIADNSPYIVQLINNRICKISVVFDRIDPDNYEEVINNTLNNDFAGFEIVLQDVFRSDPRISMKVLKAEEKTDILAIKENIVFNLKRYYKKKIKKVLEDVAFDLSTEKKIDFEKALENNILDFDPYITKNEFCRMLN